MKTALTDFPTVAEHVKHHFKRPARLADMLADLRGAQKPMSPPDFEANFRGLLDQFLAVDHVREKFAALDDNEAFVKESIICLAVRCLGRRYENRE